MADQLFPRPPRRMKQPRKDVLREHLAAATEELIQLRAEVEHLRMPWWRRFVGRKRHG